jgi:hypothetical protein
MEMSSDQRNVLAILLRREQRVRFDNVAKAAYIAAGVNSATWTRALNGDTLKPRSLNKIIRGLWPDTDGDWSLIVGDPESVGGERQASSYVASPGDRVPAGVSDDEVLREIRAMRAEVDKLAGLPAQLHSLSERVEKLEKPGP